MSYRSEADFSAALVGALKSNCPFIQRLESAVTGRGIPDLYLRFPAQEVWVELKNDRYTSIYNAIYEVQWRKGQQAWHLDYLRVSKTPVITAVAMRDGFLVIPLHHRFTHNIVPATEVYSCTALKDVVHLLKEAGK
jgi:hypothetical protein